MDVDSIVNLVILSNAILLVLKFGIKEKKINIFVSLALIGVFFNFIYADIKEVSKKPNFLELLNINDKPKETELKNNFKLLLAKYHPDSNDASETKFQELQELRDCLTGRSALEYLSLYSDFGIHPCDAKNDPSIEKSYDANKQPVLSGLLTELFVILILQCLIMEILIKSSFGIYLGLFLTISGIIYHAAILKHSYLLFISDQSLDILYTIQNEFLLPKFLIVYFIKITFVALGLISSTIFIFIHKPKTNLSFEFLVKKITDSENIKNEYIDLRQIEMLEVKIRKRKFQRIQEKKNVFYIFIGGLIYLVLTYFGLLPQIIQYILSNIKNI